MLYVLELEDGFFYVGKTYFPTVRKSVHLTVGGCEWTKLHKPKRVMFEIEGDSEESENILTLQIMYKFGWQQVRGGRWSSKHLHTSPLELKELIHDDSNSIIEYCVICNETGHFMSSCNKKNIDIKCHRCQQMGHLKNQCLNKVQCFQCKQPGHMSDMCPNLDKATCFLCGESGHFKNDCLKNTNKEVCFNCGLTSHFASKCPTIKCHKCRKTGHISVNCKWKKN